MVFSGKWARSLLLPLLLVLSACSTTPVTRAPVTAAPISPAIPPLNTNEPPPTAHEVDPSGDESVVSQPPVVKHNNGPHPKVALVLGGGAARGFAHVGVIRALESHGIVPDMVIGTSAGSFVGALYAYGYSAERLTRMARNMDEAELSDWSVPFFSQSMGLLKGEGVQSYVNRAVKNQPIEKFRIPFGAVATDLQSGKAVMFRRGNAGMAVRASSAVPGVFQPVQIGQRSYVDGGLVAPVPVSFAKDMGAQFIIAVNISAQPEGQAAQNMVGVVLQTFTIMGQTINEYALKDADIVIKPALAEMKGSDFAGRRVAMLAGENAVLRALPEIKKKLAAWGS